MNFILFLLASTGFEFITNKSTLFKGLRSYISGKCVKYENEFLLHNKKTFRRFFCWWLENIFSCSLCMSVYAGSGCASLVWLSQYYSWVIWFLYPLAAVPVVSLLEQFWSKQNRK